MVFMNIFWYFLRYIQESELNKYSSNLSQERLLTLKNRLRKERQRTKWQNDKKKVEHNVANWIAYNQIQPSTGTLERPSCIRWIANSFPQKCKRKQIIGSNTI